MCELLTSNDDSLAAVVENITTEKHNIYLINLYEILHIIHVEVSAETVKTVHLYKIVGRKKHENIFLVVSKVLFYGLVFFFYQLKLN